MTRVVAIEFTLNRRNIKWIFDRDNKPNLLSVDHPLSSVSRRYFFPHIFFFLFYQILRADNIVFCFVRNTTNVLNESDTEYERYFLLSTTRMLRFIEDQRTLWDMSERNLIAKEIFCQCMDRFSDGLSQLSGHEPRVGRAKLRLNQRAFSRETLEADWSSVLEVKPIRYGGAREMVMTMLRW